MALPSRDQVQLDDLAFAELYEHYYDRVVRYIAARTGSRDDAQEMAGDVFVRALESLDTIQERGIPPGAWLFRVAHNLVVDLYRKRARRRSVPLEQAGATAAPGPPPTPVRGAPKTVRADRLLKLNDQMERIEERVRKMSEQASDAHTRRSFVRAQESLGEDLRHARGVLKRADKARKLPRKLQQEAGVTGASSGEAKPGSTISVLRYVTAEVVEVELVRVDGGVRVDLMVVGPEGRRQVVRLMPGAAQLLRGELPGTLEDLRIHGAVQLAVDPATGEVRQVRMLPEP